MVRRTSGYRSLSRGLFLHLDNDALPLRNRSGRGDRIIGSRKK
jgi:hypothetical protein